MVIVFHESAPQKPEGQGAPVIEDPALYGLACVARSELPLHLPLGTNGNRQRG